MKTIKEIQEENRKIIILANNPDAKTYKEALEMELGFGCIYIIKGEKELLQLGWERFQKTQFGNWEIFYDGDPDSVVIIGKPLTLDRVLKFLIIHQQKWVKEQRQRVLFLEQGNIINLKDNIFWDLNKETLEEQTEEAQRAVNKLLIK